jgi:hypothetical protein
MRVEDIPLVEIEAPNPSDKLHPVEEEDDDDWEDFKRSVNKELQKPLEVVEQNGHYRLIDGDRRFRALEEGESDTASCIVKSDKDEDTVLVDMVRANEFRKPSDKNQRARTIAQLTAPWLLPPGERKNINTVYSQSELAEQIGCSQPTINIWLSPVKDQNKLRDALSGTVSGRQLEEEDMEMIDEIISLLKGRGDDGGVVMGVGQEGFVAEKISNMDGLNLGELQTVADKASAESWNTNKFLEYLDEHYAYDELEEQADTGMMGDTDFEDDLTGGVSTGDVEQGHQHEETPDTDFGMPDVSEVEWEEVVDDSELNGETLGSLKARQMVTQTFQDNGAIAINILCAKTGMSEQDVMEKFVQPLVVDRAYRFLQDD